MTSITIGPRPLAQSTLVNEYYRTALPVGFFKLGPALSLPASDRYLSLSNAWPFGLW